MDIDYQAYRPAAIFLNGVYWGILNIRDKADEAFPEQNYDLDADTDFDMFDGRSSLQAGNREAWNTLYDFISANDRSGRFSRSNSQPRASPWRRMKPGCASGWRRSTRTAQFSSSTMWFSCNSKP